jgi:hypothetical protein
MGSGNLGSGVFEPSAHLVAAREPGLLKNHLTVPQYYEIGNALDTIAIRQFGLGFGIDFQHDGFSGHFASDGLDFRGRGTARSAPSGPEIH